MKLYPQSNLKLPIELRIYLISWFQVAYEYEAVQNAAERMVYYCAAKCPNIFDDELPGAEKGHLIPYLYQEQNDEMMYLLLKTLAQE